MNLGIIKGYVVTDVIEESENRGEKFYTFEISTKRQSGVEDVLLCRVSERLSGFDKLHKGARVKVSGRFSSHRKYVGSVMRLCLAVFVLSIDEFYDEDDGEDLNDFELEGKISKIKELKSIGNRKVQELNLLVQRKEYGRQDLIPLVTWGRTATYCNEKLAINDEIKVRGRIQSRERVNDKGEKYRLYNLSVIDLAVLSTNNPKGGGGESELSISVDEYETQTM